MVCYMRALNTRAIPLAVVMPSALSSSKSLRSRSARPSSLASDRAIAPTALVRECALPSKIAEPAATRLCAGESILCADGTPLRLERRQDAPTTSSFVGHTRVRLSRARSAQRATAAITQERRGRLTA